jgi:hypothetical protein
MIDLENNKPHFNILRSEISRCLSNLPYDNGDLSDIGNEIGIVISKYLSEKPGWDLESFIHGLEHGIKLKNK